MQVDINKLCDVFLWVGLAGEQGKRVVLFYYASTRAGSVPISLLGKFNCYLVTDDHRGYNTVGENSNITRIACWAHFRRKFTEALKS